jgi:hypothetical protein
LSVPAVDFAFASEIGPGFSPGNHHPERGALALRYEIVDAQTNSNEAPQHKKRMPRPILIAIVEVSMILGCVLAFFTLPDDTRISFFLFACGGCLILGNLLLFRSLNKPADPNRELKKTDTATQILIFALIYLPLIWELYKKDGR